jgi:Lon protease-like protein
MHLPRGRGRDAAMIWNQWTRRPAVTAAELRAAVASVADSAAGSLEPEIADDGSWVVFTVAGDGLDAVVEALDPELDELDDDWEDEIEALEDGENHRIVIELARDGEDTSLRWDPKSGDNDAAWSVAWLITTRLMRLLGAEQTTVSARLLLEPAAPIAETQVHLPLFPLRADVVLPTRKARVFHVGRPASLDALRNAVSSHGGRCVAAMQRDPAIEEPARGDLHSIACVVEVVELLDDGRGNANVFVRGIARARVLSVEGFMVHAEPATPGAAGPLTEERARLLDGANALLPYLFMENMPDDALEVLAELPAEQLGDGAAEIFGGVLPTETRAEVLQTLDASARAAHVADAIEKMLEDLRAARQSDGGSGD